jgi:hypothetical protein
MMPNPILKKGDDQYLARIFSTIYKAELTQSLLSKEVVVVPKLPLEQILSMVVGHTLIVYLALNFVVRNLKQFE